MKLFTDIKKAVRTHRKFFNNANICLLFLLMCRIVANFLIPLNDSTEARYSEIARKMVETGNWVTLFHDYGVPFWAKPPLSTWLSAASMKLFGMNEFAVRLPATLMSIGVVWLSFWVARQQNGRIAGIITALVLSGAGCFFLNAGVVMTEPALIFSTTLSIVAFWLGITKKDRLMSYLFFVGLGLGLLAKGPIASVLVGLPLFFWVLLQNKWVVMWQRLPWISGVLIMCAIALPWYIWAEQRTPGFLNYFIVGEHIHRFLTPGWNGDKYGSAHVVAHGMIWVYALVCFLPWSIIGLGWIFQNRKRLTKVWQDEDGWVCYLVLCTFVPLVFFTLASNIIYPYVLPSLPPFALLFAEIWVRDSGNLSKGFWIHYCALIVGFLGLIVAVAFFFFGGKLGHSQKLVVNAWLEQNPTPQSLLIYWGNGVDYSAQFYTNGRAKVAFDKHSFCQLVLNHQENYMASSNRQLEVPTALLQELTVVAGVDLRTSHVTLYRCPKVLRYCDGE